MEFIFRVDLSASLLCCIHIQNILILLSWASCRRHFVCVGSQQFRSQQFKWPRKGFVCFFFKSVLAKTRCEENRLRQKRTKFHAFSFLAKAFLALVFALCRFCLSPFSLSLSLHVSEVLFSPLRKKKKGCCSMSSSFSGLFCRWRSPRGNSRDLCCYPTGWFLFFLSFWLANGQ